jgi:hypothetical protein
MTLVQLETSKRFQQAATVSVLRLTLHVLKLDDSSTVRTWSMGDFFMAGAMPSGPTGGLVYGRSGAEAKSPKIRARQV